MVIVESPVFSRWRDTELEDDAFSDLVDFLVENPESGTLIPGGCGLRKIRIGLAGRGKRGGGRVIYFFWNSEQRLYLLYGYAKTVQSDLTKDQIHSLANLMKEEIDG